MRGRSQQGLECRVILLRGGAVGPTPIRCQLGVILKGFAQEGAAVVDVRSGDVAAEDGGGLAAGYEGVRLGVVGPVGHSVRGVVEPGRLSEPDGKLPEVVVDFEHFGAIEAFGVLVG